MHKALENDPIVIPEGVRDWMNEELNDGRRWRAEPKAPPEVFEGNRKQRRAAKAQARKAR